MVFRALFGKPLHRLGLVWLVLAIAVSGAVAPTVSHAVALAQEVPPMMLDLCLAGKSTSHLTDTPSGRGSALSLAHCPFCLLHTDRVAPAPHLLPYLFSVLGGYPEPTFRQAFFFVSFPTLGPPSRGPPAFS